MRFSFPRKNKVTHINHRVMFNFQLVKMSYNINQKNKKSYNKQAKKKKRVAWNSTHKRNEARARTHTRGEKNVPAYHRKNATPWQEHWNTSKFLVHDQYNIFKGKNKKLLLRQFVLQIFQNSFSSSIQDRPPNAETNKEKLLVQDMIVKHWCTRKSTEAPSTSRSTKLKC